MKKFLHILGYLALAIFLLLAGIYLFLQTDSGRRTLIHLVSSITERGKTHINIASLQGNIFSDMTMTNVTVADPQGVWISLDNLHVVWRPLALLFKGQVIKVIEVNTTTLTRLPTASSSQKETNQKNSSFSLKSLKAYLPNYFLLKTLDLEKGITGQRQVLTVKAQKTTGRYIALIETLEGPATHLNVVFSMKNQMVQAEIQFQEEPQGIVSHLLKLPSQASLKANVNINTDSTGIVHLTQGSIQTGKTQITIEGNLDRQKNIISGNMKALSSDLSEWQNLLGSSIAGNIQAQASVQASSQNLQATIDMNSNHLDAQDLSFQRVTSHFGFTGAPNKPVVQGQITGQGKSSGYPFNVSLQGNWQKDILHMQITGHSNTATSTADVNFRSRLSLWPFQVDFSGKTPLNGSVSANIPLNIFNSLLWASRQRIGGFLSGTMKIQGSVGEPQLQGNFSLTQGEYSHSDSGVCLRNIQAALVGSNREIFIRNLRSTDSQGGSLTGQAQITLIGEKPLRGNIAFRHFQLFCGGVASGNINGDLNINGALASSLLSGRLLVGPLNVQIPGGQSQANIPTVDTVRGQPKTASQSAKSQIIRLNVAINAPNQIFVRGRGLDAEFGGHLDVTGTTSHPEINGLLSSRRGNFNLLDRVLTLTKADIRFEGPLPPSPFFDVTSEITVEDTTLNVGLSGSAAKPKLVLSSEPSLPQDEILSLLLFRRRLQNITPFQAIRLAQAARVLAGYGGDEPGFLDTARAALGLSELDIGMDNSNNVTVSAGKYITDRVYVGVQQGAKPEDRTVKTEIEISPSFSAHTTLDSQGNQGVGVGWKRDY